MHLLLLCSQWFPRPRQCCLPYLQPNSGNRVRPHQLSINKQVNDSSCHQNIRHAKFNSSFMREYRIYICRMDNWINLRCSGYSGLHGTWNSKFFSLYQLRVNQSVILFLSQGLPKSGGEKNYLEFIYRRPKYLVTCCFGIFALFIVSTPFCIHYRKGFEILCLSPCLIGSMWRQLDDLWRMYDTPQSSFCIEY